MNTVHQFGLMLETFLRDDNMHGLSPEQRVAIREQIRKFVTHLGTGGRGTLMFLTAFPDSVINVLTRSQQRAIRQFRAIIPQ